MKKNPEVIENYASLVIRGNNYELIDKISMKLYNSNPREKVFNLFVSIYFKYKHILRVTTDPSKIPDAL
jgi:hypothetical protein